MMAHVDALREENNVFRDIGGMIRDALGHLAENLNRHNQSEQKRYYRSK